MKIAMGTSFLIQFGVTLKSFLVLVNLRKLIRQLMKYTWRSKESDLAAVALVVAQCAINSVYRLAVVVG